MTDLCSATRVTPVIRLLARVFFAGALTVTIAAGMAGTANAEDSLRQELRGYNVNASVGALLAQDRTKSVAAESKMASNSGPVLNSIAPDAHNGGAFALGERRGAVEQMLQSHEFSFGQRKNALASKDAGKLTGVDLDAVKLRVSRNSVLIRAQFNFN